MNDDYDYDISAVPDVITSYFNQIKKIPVLTPEEEIYYIKQIQNGDQEALMYFIKCNLRLVVSIAKQYYHNTTMAFEDLIQEGNLGLIKAVLKFDVEKGNKFSTFITPWIRQAISRALREQSKTIRLPADKYQLVKKLKKEIKNFSDEHQREPTASELAEQFNVSQQVIIELFPYINDCVSLDGVLDSDERTTFGELIEDTKSPLPESNIIATDNTNIILSVLNTLSEQEKDVIILRFGLCGNNPHTLDEIGEKYNVTKERIRQVEAKALRKLRQPSRANILKEAM